MAKKCATLAVDSFSFASITCNPRPGNLSFIRTRNSSSRPCISSSLTTKDRRNDSANASSTNQGMLPFASSDLATKKGKERVHLLAKVFSHLDKMINQFFPLLPSNDPSFILSGNFAPVDELPPTECEVILGQLPECLSGAYIRNGPNPQIPPIKEPCHLFDGDGMLHCLTISDNRAVLCSRYVRTERYIKEREAGTPVFPKIFSGFYGGILAFFARVILILVKVRMKLFDPSRGFGVANTSLAVLGGRLYALDESDLPYEVRLTVEGDIETIGRQDFDGRLRLNMTAHPKVDPETGEVFAFRYQLAPVPSLTYFRINVDGVKEPDVSIKSTSSFSFLHDFAITDKHAIFPDGQIATNLQKFILDKKCSSPFSFNPSKVSRVGIIPRHSTDGSSIKWFEVPGFNFVHVFNAWDDKSNDQVLLLAPNCLSLEFALDRFELTQTSLEMVTVNLKTGDVCRCPITSIKNLEFGAINPAYAGKKTRYVYASTCDGPKVTGVVKLDLSKMMQEEDSCQDDHQIECAVATRMYGNGCFGGEPYFIARHPERDTDEDDGYVVSFFHNEITGESRFIVMDAKSPSLEIVAAVRLPQRVPYGFHGMFLRHKEVEKFH